jgi:hypothetical protein
MKPITGLLACSPGIPALRRMACFLRIELGSQRAVHGSVMTSTFTLSEREEAPVFLLGASSFRAKHVAIGVGR